MQVFLKVSGPGEEGHQQAGPEDSLDSPLNSLRAHLRAAAAPESPCLSLRSPSLGKGSGPCEGTGMARTPIGCEAPCERCWLVGGREEEAVSRATEGQERLRRRRPRLRSAGRSAARDRLEAAAPRSRVRAGRSSPRRLAGPGRAALPRAGSGRGKVCSAAGRAGTSGLGDAPCRAPGPGQGGDCRWGVGWPRTDPRRGHTAARGPRRRVGASRAGAAAAQRPCAAQPPAHADGRRALVQKRAGTVLPGRCGPGARRGGAGAPRRTFPASAAPHTPPSRVGVRPSGCACPPEAGWISLCVFPGFWGSCVCAFPSA